MKTALFALIIFAVATQGATRKGTVFCSSSDTCRWSPDTIDKAGDAWGTFEDTLETVGWGILNVYTNNQSSHQMLAAGVAEGALTWNRIEDMVQNVNGIFFKTKQPSAKLLQFIQDQDDWAAAQVAANPNDPLWIQVGGLRDQIRGLKIGHDLTSNNTVSSWDFSMLNGVGDLLDLISAVDKSERIDWMNLDPEMFKFQVFKKSLCSGFVGITPDLSDLFFAHSAWFEYSATNRIFKHYHLNLPSSSGSTTNTLSFSSYPGFLESLDDFYQMSSGLVMVQTTNSVFNTSLYDLVKPQSLLAWQRVRVANQIASSGKEWCDILATHNSGTYENQYMVVNLNLFTPGEPLRPGTLTVCEQIPGLVVQGDMTAQLERGYWASYNIPFFPEIYNKSGYPEVVEKYGPRQSYDMAPRAQIFRRDAHTVQDIESLQALMRYNDYKHDPIAQGDAYAAICSRGDLAAAHPSAGGCYDTKVSSYLLHKKGLTSYAINGPTRSHGIPPFTWTDKFPNTHVGDPQTYDFDFISVSPAPSA